MLLHDRGESGEGRIPLDPDQLDCNLNTARSVLLEALLAMKCNQMPPSSLQIHILQNLMYVSILQDDPRSALHYGDILQPLLSPAIS